MKIQVCIAARDLQESSAYLAAVSLAGEEVGRTEVVTNSSCPNWEKAFILDVDGVDENISVGVLCESDESELGNASFNLSNLLEKKVEGKATEGGGLIFVYAAEHDVPGSLKFKICAKGLKNTEGFLGMSRDKSDPFFIIKGKSGDDVYKSDVIQNTLEPVWPETEVQLKDMCDGDLDAPLKFVIYDHDPNGSDDFMGNFQRSVNGLISTMESGDDIDINKNGKEAGNVLVLGAELVGYINPVSVGRGAIEVAADAMKTKSDYYAMSSAAVRALEKAQKARVVADEKVSHSQELAEQLADAEKAAADAKALAQKAVDKAASQPAAGILTLELRGEKLKNTEGFFRKPDPFFVLQTPPEAEGSEWDNVFVSDVIKDTLNPSWQPVEVDMSALGVGDLDETLRVVVFDKESDGKHELMGFFESSVNRLLSSSKSGQSFSMMKGGDETGTIIIAGAGLVGYVDPADTKKKLEELANKAEEARYFVMGRKAAAKVALDAAEEAKNDADELSKKADSAAEKAEAAKVAADDASSKLAALVG